MRNVITVIAVALVATAGVVGYGQSREADPIARAAAAIGGRDRILAARTLTVEGYGQLAAQSGGGNVTTSPDAPMKWTDVNDYVQVIDLTNGRMRVRQTQAADFVAATLQRMRGTVSTQAPGKPLTELIVSHHHFDHTGGFRAAVAEGLTVMTARGNEEFLREVASRPARLFPDALGPKPRPIRIRTVDDHLKLKDGSMEIDIYRVMANVHMADALMVHVPRERLLAQGDLFDVGWVGYWWGTSYIDNVRYRNLEVERDVPVHGKVLPFAEVQQHIARQIKNAQEFCAEVAAAKLSMRGCPVKTTVDR